MDIKKALADFKGRIDKEIAANLDRAIRESSKKDALITQSLKYVKKNILSGGKRLRPALMYYGYIGAGGKERQKVLKASVGIELIHAFLLIHDDIMDRDNKRHGQDTINFTYEKLGKRYFPRSDWKHFGSSMAIIVGDMVGAIGNQVIFDSEFPPERIMKALSQLQSIVSLTVIGQAKDIYMEYKKDASEEEVLRMYEYKTARYTLEGPLHLGAILGGAKKEILESYSRCAIPLGIAFQIQDDILGIFGSEKKIGKAVGSDIQEGKQTILVVKAKEMGNASQRKRLLEILEKKDIGVRDIEEFRNLIRDTGSLEYATDLAEKLIRKGKQAIHRAGFAKETEEFLLAIADYMMKREI